MLRRLILFFSLAIACFQAQAQTGTISGKVNDAEFGDELIGVSILVQGTTTGTVTDLNGFYTLTLASGSYTLEIAYLGYQKKVVTGVLVKDGEVTDVSVALSESSETLKEVVVEARKVNNTENALISMRKKALTVQDGISAQEISRSGAGNAGEAVKQVTGASVEDGKYMVVRGLGDRYSITQLNGVTLPSTDPYRNSTSLDLIPSFMLDNIVTSKTFTPDQPGNFTGGNMNIKTKSYPETFFLTANVSLGYNTISSLNNNFISNSGGNDELDEELQDKKAFNDRFNRGTTKRMMRILGKTEMSDSDREKANEYLMAQGRSALASGAGIGDYHGVLKEALADQDEAIREQATPVALDESTNSGIDFGVSTSFGNKIKLGEDNKRVIGYVIGAKYSQSYSLYQDGQYNQWESLLKEDFLQNNFDLTETKGSVTDAVGAFGSLTYQFNPNHQIGVNAMFNQSDKSYAQELVGVRQEINDGQTLRSLNQGETNRSMQNYQLRGKHMLTSLRKAEVEWVGGYTRNSQLEPDLRFFNSVQQASGEWVPHSNAGPPRHYYRELIDEQFDGKVDVTVPITKKKGNKIKFGGAYSEKNREFWESYMETINQESADVVPASDSTLDWGRGWYQKSNFGVNLDPDILDVKHFFTNNTREANPYDGKEVIAAAYAMASYGITPRLKAVAGARLETTDIQVWNFEDTGSIKTSDFLPSLGFIYELNERMNIRASYARTLARPNMRELAPFESFEFLGGFAYGGNADLERTLIQNYDLRWEFYIKPGDLLAVSGYYKTFQNPIVKKFIIASSNGLVLFDNVPEARVYGIELEFRKSLSFISDKLKNFKFSSNFSYIFSRVDVDAKELSISRELNPDLPETRPFQGQSPYLINVGVFYDSDSIGLESAITLNVFGERLYGIGAAGLPDVYEQPRPMLNYSVRKSIGKHFKASLNVENILGSIFKTTQTHYDKEYVIREYEIGTTFTLGIGYKF